MRIIIDVEGNVEEDKQDYLDCIIIKHHLIKSIKFEDDVISEKAE